MKKITTVILGTFVIVGSIWFLVWGLSKIPPTWTPFIAGGIGFSISRLYETWKENKTRLYEKKREVYSRLIRPWQSILISSMANKDKKNDVKVSPELITEAGNAAFDAILYASDEVIKDYGIFRTTAAEGNPTPELVLGNLTKLLKSIRKDLGHTYSNLTDTEILLMFMNLTETEKQKFKSNS